MEKGYVKKKLGVVFKKEAGKLFVFDNNSVSVLRGWPFMRAWKKTCVKQPVWTGYRPSLCRLDYEIRTSPVDLEEYRRKIETGEQELPLEYKNAKDANPYPSDLCRWYFETTPQDVRELISPFWTAKWSLMSYLSAGGKPAKELLISSPAIAFMLANNRVFHTPKVTRPLRAIRTWFKIGKTRKELLCWLGFPPAKSTIKVLGKIPQTDISIYSLTRIRTCLQDPDLAKILRHQMIIDRAVLAFLDKDFCNMLTSKLLRELRTELLSNLSSADYDLNANAPAHYENREILLSKLWKKEDQRIWLLVRDTVRMFRHEHPDTPLPKVENLNALRQLHNELITSIRRNELKNTVFPAPPIAGNKEIVPITDYDDLCSEGREQHNCVVTYFQDIMNGKSFIYKVLSPERCTLEIVPRNGKWVINQLLAICNRAPREAVHDAVRTWLKENQKK